MKRYLGVVFFIVSVLAHAEAGTLTLKNGEELSFNSEKEFVEILLEEFLPSDFRERTGYFIITDSSSEKKSLRILLVQPETLSLNEAEQTSLYPSIQKLVHSQEYKKTISSFDREHTFAVEVSFDELDMTFVHTISPPSGTRGSGSSSKILIDARGEGNFKFMKD